MESVLLNVAGHRRSPATMPGYHRGRPPRNKGEQYPADPPTVEEIVAGMRTVGDRSNGHRLRALIVLLWRAWLRITEALSLQESDLDSTRGAVLVRRGKGPYVEFVIGRRMSGRDLLRSGFGGGRGSGRGLSAGHRSGCSEVVEEREKGVGGSVSAGLAVGGRGAVDRSLFESEVACR